MARNANKPTITVTLDRYVLAPVGVLKVQATHVDFPGRTFELDVTEDGRVRRFVMEVTTDDDDEVTSRQLRAVPLGELSAVARQRLLDHLEDSPAWVTSPKLRRDLRTRAGARRKDPPDNAFLATIARDYIAASMEDPATALKEVGKMRGYAPGTVRAFRDQARKRGLYQSHGRGKPGGRLTPKGRAALKEGNDR